MSKIKISQLPTSTQTDGLYTIGVNANNSSVKVPIGELIDDKVDKVSGKQLSTNDYTNEEKQKLADIQDDMLMITYGVTPFTTIQQAILNYKYLACYETTERKAYHIVSYSATAVQMQCVVGNVNYGIAVTSTNQWSKASLTLPKVEYVDTSVAAEATARANADNALTTSISNEASARQSADNNLSTSISKRIAKPDASVPQGYVPASDGQGDVSWSEQKDKRLPDATAAEKGKYVAVGDAGEYILKSGGGGGGTSDYEELDNLPKLNGVTIIGDKPLSDYDLQSRTEAYLAGDAMAQALSSTNRGFVVSEDADGVQTTRVLTSATFTTNQTEKDNAVKMVHVPINAKVTSMNSAFRNCVKMKEINTKGWVTTAVTDLYMCWYNMPLIEYLDLSTFDTSAVTEIGWSVFNQVAKLRYIKLSAKFFNTSAASIAFTNVTNLGVATDGTDNGWAAHLVTVTPTLEEGVSRSMTWARALFDASWSAQYKTALNNKGWTINRA